MSEEMVQANASAVASSEKVNDPAEQWSDSEIVAAVKNGTHMLVPLGGYFEIGDFDLDTWENFEGDRGLMISLSREECRFVAIQTYARRNDLFGRLGERKPEEPCSADSLNQPSK